MVPLFTDSSDKLRQPKIGALMKQVMGAKEDAPGTFSRGGERLSACTALCSCRRLSRGLDQDEAAVHPS